jgi:dihydrodipicolinate synthase/N-acetylneuraminate lyase
MLRGTLAAALTPLCDDGAALDDDAFRPYCDFLVAGGLDGLLAFGTNGEGVLFSVEERMRGLRLFIDASRERLQVAAHCGAQTTADTVVLAADAAEAGADAVAVIGPPYFPLDTRAQLAHFSAAADACAPLPFYVYEFARTSGYAVSLDTLARLRDKAPNFVGMKVSDTPWDAFQPYLLDGLAVFVGPEALIHLGIQAGAVGAVSALAGAFPAEVAAVVRDPTEVGAATLAELRAGVERFPRQAALKRVVASRGVLLRSDVRAPLRDLTESEAADLDSWLASTTAAAA